MAAQAAERVNRCIQLHQSGQPLFYTGLTERLSHDLGRQMASTWADFILVEFEHYSLDTRALTDFMYGLSDGGPTNSGHRTPTVLCTLPANGMTATEVEANSWQIRHILSSGVHGIVLCHARSAEATRAFVNACRYPTALLGRDAGLSEGTRGLGGQFAAAEIWGVSPDEYIRRAEPWPLNPDGELLLGVKIEDRDGAARAHEIASTPGLFFGEWGPGDMSLSHGHIGGHDPPYRADVDHARQAVQKACSESDLAFLCSWNDPAMSVEARAQHLLHTVGATIISGEEALAQAGRNITGRQMPV